MVVKRLLSIAFFLLASQQMVIADITNIQWQNPTWSSAQEIPEWVEFKCPLEPTKCVNDSAGVKRCGSISGNGRGWFMEFHISPTDNHIQCVYGDVDAWEPWSTASYHHLRVTDMYKHGDCRSNGNPNPTMCSAKYKLLRQFQCPKPEHFVISPNSRYRWHYMGNQAEWADQKVSCPIAEKTKCHTDPFFLGKPKELKRKSEDYGAVYIRENTMYCSYDVNAPDDTPLEVYLDLTDRESCHFLDATMPDKPHDCAGMKTNECIVLCKTTF